MKWKPTMILFVILLPILASAWVARAFLRTWVGSSAFISLLSGVLLLLVQSCSTTKSSSPAVAAPGTVQGTDTPTSLAFGSVAINTTSSPQTVTIKNTGTANLNITGVSIAPSQFAVSGPGSTSLAPGASATYNVTFTPTTVSNYTGSLSFATNSATAVPAVALSGTGLNQSGSASCSRMTYYVSNSGNDSNSGISTTSPWRTVAKGVAFEPSLRAGDCILFQRGGVWSEQLSISNVHGTQSNPITFGNYGTGNLPVLDGGSTRLYGIVDGYASGQIASSYLAIDGFEVRNTTRGGIIFAYLAQPGITIQNNYVHHNGYGAYPGACSGCFHVDDGNYGYNEGISFVGYPIASYGAKIINNIITIEGGHNALMVDQDLASPLILGNKVGPGCTHNCIDFKRSTGVLISKNIVNCSTSVTVNGSTYPACTGNAFYTEQLGTFTETGTYEENVGYGAAPGYACFGANGVPASDGPIALRYYDNTCYRVSTGENAFVISSCFGGDLMIENNILAGGGINLGTCPATWDYNDKYGTTGGPSGAHDMSVDPLFVSPSTMDFHLQSGSPLLNNGNSSILNVPYMGACGTSGTCP